VISTKTGESCVIVEITDNGCGIVEKDMQKIFEPFFTTKEVGKGTGQGLSVVHSVIVDKHNGEIEVDSQTGRGTTLTVRLPLESDLNGGPANAS